VQLTKDFFIVGNYGFNELQGAIFSGFIENTKDKSNIENNSKLTNSIQTKKIMLLLKMLTIGMLITFMIILCVYFWVIFFTPKIDEKKKKKEEEEYSPYKVYSYLGYTEADDNIVVPDIPYNYYQSYNFPNNNLYFPNYYQNYPSYYQNNVSDIQPLSPMEKGSLTKNDKVEYSNETTVSYKGYTYDMIQKNYKEKIKPILDEIKK